MMIECNREDILSIIVLAQKDGVPMRKGKTPDRYFAYMRNDLPVGLLRTLHFPNGLMRIDGLYVLPLYRCQGIGKMMVLHAMTLTQGMIDIYTYHPWRFIDLGFYEVKHYTLKNGKNVTYMRFDVPEMPMPNVQPISDLEQLQEICSFINDMIEGSNIKATPGIVAQDGFSIAWVRISPGKGEYPITKNESYQKLIKAGYNPKALVEFSVTKAKGKKS